MSEQEAKHILDSHVWLFDYVKAISNLPDRSYPAIEEIYQALNTLEPYFWDRACDACTFRMIQRANEKREGLKKFTFPNEKS